MSKEQHSGVMKAWEATLRKTQAAKKRANSIFGTMSVAPHADDEEDEDPSTASTGEIYHAERFLPNGDIYTGQWYDNFPHGHGKYLWTDGCMYVGEWYRGKAMGRGRFSWPSGSVYDGEFKSNYMDGKGTYAGRGGDTYRGQWIMNLKHGHGYKTCANGDEYEGDWRRGLQEGNGRYKWKNGDYYVGEWKNGAICGRGTFFWASTGNRYDGYWEDGLPKGNGTFLWSDGSFYMGNWSKDPEERSGSYYPSGSSLMDGNNPEWDPQQVFEELSKYVICPGEKVPMLPSQKKLAMWRSSKAGDPKPRRMSVDGRVSVGVERTVDRMKMFESDGDFGGNVLREGGRDLDADLLRLEMEDCGNLPTPGVGQQLRIPKNVKKQGETIYKGHKNYELMLNLQLGIRHSVGRAPPPDNLDLKASAFDVKEKIWTRFPPEGSKYTPPHQSCDFKWKDYCPQ
ncbi:hypothetical protein CRG98_028757, partial [Punica granatum]